MLGVIDLRAGRAVRAIGGRRRFYRPVVMPDAQVGDPRALANLYLRHGATGLYVADLDGILLRRPTWKVLEELMALPCPIWLDLGLRGIEDWRAGFVRLPRNGLVWIAATETVGSAVDWEQWTRYAPTDQLAVGVDIRARHLTGTRIDPRSVVKRATQAGIRRFVVLDLAAVGGRRGPVAAPWCRALQQLAPTATFASGGGVRNRSDLHLLSRSGCQYVLAATALLEGQLR